jgi:Zn-dependent protease with chaperone function
MIPSSAYRYPTEETTFALALLLVIGVLVIGAITTFLIIPILAVVLLFFTYTTTQAMHSRLMQTATHVTPQSSPELLAIGTQCANKLGVSGIQMFVSNSGQRNAYTFGMGKPFSIVVYSSLLQVMDADELRFIVGHEMGHVALDHTWLNTLLGGMAGVPTSLGLAVILTLAFRGWNRACEYSADRAGLIACGNLNNAILALVEIVAGDIRTQEQYQQALALIEREDGSFIGSMTESLASHPMIVKRIRELQKFAASEQFRRLSANNENSPV